MRIKHLVILALASAPLALDAQDTISPVKIIRGKIAPKSIVHSGNGLFFAQNMMYRHTVTVYNREFELVKTISDRVKLKDFGFAQYEGHYRGAPVECTFTNGGRYAWVSNYEMSGSESFSNPGCDDCHGAGLYDSSFVYKIDTESLEVVNIVKVGAVPKYLTTSADGKYLLVSNWSGGDVSVVDLQREEEIKRLKVGRYPRGIVVHPSQNIAYVAVMGSNKITVINLDDFTLSHYAGIGKSPRHLCIDKQGEYLYVSLNGERKIRRYHLSTSEKHDIPTGTMPRSMALSGKWLYVVNYGDDSYSKIDVTTLAVHAVGKTSSKPIGITLDEVDGRVWVACYSGSIQIFDDSDIIIPDSPQEFDLLASTSEFFGRVLSVFVMGERDITTTHTSEILSVDLSEEQPGVEQMAATEKPSIPTINSGFYVVVGSFSREENAKKLTRLYRDKGYDTQSFTNNNMTVCSVFYSPDIQSAQATADKLRTAGTDCWILNR